jgi:flagellar hook-length control protein FliK
MIPLLTTLTAVPGSAPASSSARTGKNPDAEPAGQFAELFASMIPASPVPGNPASAAETAATASPDAPGIPETGQPNNGFPEASSVATERVETSAMEAALVMNQRAQHPALSTSAVLPSGVTATGGPTSPASIAVGSATVTENGNEPAAGSAESGSVVQTLGSDARLKFPVAVAPLLTLQVSGAVPGPDPRPLSVAEAPTLEIQLPEEGTSLSVAPTPGTTFTLPGLTAAATQEALGGPTDSEPVETNDAMVAGTNGTATVTGQAVAVVPASGAHAQEPATGSTSAEAQNGSGSEGQTPEGSVATALADSEVAPAASNTAAQVLPPAAGQTEARVSTADSMAPARISSDGSTSAVDPLEASATESPLVRTQAPAPLHRQLLGPIATLAAGPNGERTLSVNIAPEALGPITVKAHLGGEGIRMELSAPTDAGREALRTMLPELRRELAAMGSGTITLSTGSDSPATTGGHSGSSGAGGGDARPFASTALPGLRTRDELAPEFPGRDTTAALHDTSHLDVMA